MPENVLRVFAGDCTTIHDGDEHRRQRGSVVVILKPDDTVLVHDGDGYRPVDWLTRADAVHCVEGDESFEITAVSDGTRLQVDCHELYHSARYPVSAAGVPVGTCPDCATALVRSNSVVSCSECSEAHKVPRDAELLATTCDCGLPTMHVERGAAFELCIDRNCESLDAAVKEQFDREWGCPDCEGDLRIIRQNGLLARCERDPDCEVAFVIPVGVVVDDCECGLPLFETASGQRCLDATCKRLTDA